MEEKTLIFIKKAIEVHGCLYNYDEVVYVNCRTKVRIKCNRHNIVFEQRPDSHLSGCKCPVCAREPFKMTNEYFLREARRIHSYYYEYPEKISTSTKKIKIICPQHGEFFQSPTVHLKGHKCKKCSVDIMAKKRVLGKENFVKKAKELHGDKIEYIGEYTTKKEPMLMRCKIHGDFYQTPDYHLIGQGCPLCGRELINEHNKQNPKGWSYTNWENAAKKSKNFDSYKVYIIKCWNDGEEFYKIGRTYRTVEERFKAKIFMPYNYEIVDTFIFEDSKECCEYERFLKEDNKESSYLPNLPFAGKNECFSYLNTTKPF